MLWARSEPSGPADGPQSDSSGVDRRLTVSAHGRNRRGWHDGAVASDHESRRTVIVALLANLGITLAKLVAAIVTGSTAMFAETVHSAADTGNSVLLIVAQRRSRRPAAPSGLSRDARRTSGRCWRRSGSSSSARFSLCTRASASCSTRSRPSRSRWPTSCSPSPSCWSWCRSCKPGAPCAARRRPWSGGCSSTSG